MDRDRRSLTTGETVRHSGLLGDDAPHEEGVSLILQRRLEKT